MLLLTLLLACAPMAEIRDACPEPAVADTGQLAACLPCESSDECRITGNPCLDGATCAHVDAVIPVAELGCSKALERRWPDDETCACVDGWCRYTP